MNEWTGVLTFGTTAEGTTEIVRPSAYAIIVVESGRIALVRTPRGLFLPGGGMNAGETVAATIEREAMEECGLEVTVGDWSVRAIEHVYSPDEAMHFEKRSTFCPAVISGPAGTPQESDHVLEWCSAEEAIVALTPDIHRWAVASWMRER